MQLEIIFNSRFFLLTIIMRQTLVMYVRNYLWLLLRKRLLKILLSSPALQWNPGPIRTERPMPQLMAEMEIHKFTSLFTYIFFLMNLRIHSTLHWPSRALKSGTARSLVLTSPTRSHLVTLHPVHRVRSWTCSTSKPDIVNENSLRLCPIFPRSRSV